MWVLHIDCVSLLSIRLHYLSVFVNSGKLIGIPGSVKVEQQLNELCLTFVILTGRDSPWRTLCLSLYMSLNISLLVLSPLPTLLWLLHFWGHQLLMCAHEGFRE